VGVKRIDAETAELTAGVVRLLRRAAEVASARSEADSTTPCAGHRSGSRRGGEPSVGRAASRARARSRGSCCAVAVSGAGIEASTWPRLRPIGQPAGTVCREAARVAARCGIRRVDSRRRDERALVVRYWLIENRAGTVIAWGDWGFGLDESEEEVR
jgi:hypothetical protein